MTAQLRENVETLERRVEERTAEISRQKQYFESLVEISPVAVVTMDRDERVIGLEPGRDGLFGYTPDEAIGRRIDELILRTRTPCATRAMDVAREAADDRARARGSAGGRARTAARSTSRSSWSR